MKSRLTLGSAMVLTLLALTACSAVIQANDQTEQTDIGVVEQVAIDTSYDGQEIEVPAGHLLVITLESNPTTGFRWELSEPIDKGILALIQSEYKPGERGKQNPPVAGAGGTEVWTFEALTAGEVTISLEYSRPWEGGEKAVQTFNLTVVIK